MHTAKPKTLCVKQMHKGELTLRAYTDVATLAQLHTKTSLNTLTHSLTGAGHK